MSKHGHHRPQIQTRPGTQITVQPVAIAERAANVPEYKRCPCCWGGQHGCGKQYGRYEAKKTTYYRCDTCGHTWTAYVVTEIVGTIIDKNTEE